MKNIINLSKLFLLLCVFSVQAETLIQVEGGMFKESVLFEQCQGCTGLVKFVPVALRDNDQNYAPLSQIVIFSVNNTVELSFGIMKTEGNQGLALFAHPAEHPKPILVRPNLDLGTPVMLGFDFSKPDKMLIQVDEKSFFIKKPFPPGRVVHVVSGMDIEMIAP